MDKGADITQKIVIAVAIILGIIIVFTIGISLYTKAKRAEGDLAKKTETDSLVQKNNSSPNISLTGESQTKSPFTYDGLVQKKKEETASTSNFEIVNENLPVAVPKEEQPTEVVEETQELPDTTQVTPPPTKPRKPVDDDQPLTPEEIARIRSLPIDDSPAGNLQTSLEEESGGEYKARY